MTSRPGGVPVLVKFPEPKVTPTMMTPCTSAAMKTVVVRRSRVGAMPSRSCSARALISVPGLAPMRRSNGFDYHVSDIEPKLLVEFTYSCRTRDVDLGYEATDHVDADEQPFRARSTSGRSSPQASGRDR